MSNSTILILVGVAIGGFLIYQAVQRATAAAQAAAASNQNAPGGFFGEVGQFLDAGSRLAGKAAKKFSW